MHALILGANVIDMHADNSQDSITKVQMSFVSIWIILIFVRVSDLTVLIYCQAASMFCICNGARLFFCTTIMQCSTNVIREYYESLALATDEATAQRLLKNV